MHLISNRVGPPRSLSCHNGRNSTRVNTLPFVFRKLRIHRNLTKAALARKVLVSEDFVSMVEDGSRIPTLKYCLACGQEFGFNPNWIKVKWMAAVMDRVAVGLRKRLGVED